MEVVLDARLLGCENFGVHPNDNSATLVLAFSDIVRVVREHGNPLRFFTP